jgi:hypothetical protein
MVGKFPCSSVVELRATTYATISQHWKMRFLYMIKESSVRALDSHQRCLKSYSPTVHALSFLAHSPLHQLPTPAHAIMSSQPDTVSELRDLFHQFLSPSSDSLPHISSPIFVSFDVAHGNKKGPGVIGISVLNSRRLSLPSPQAAKDVQHTHSPLWTYTYVFSIRPARRTSTARTSPLQRRCAESHEDERAGDAAAHVLL